MGPGRPATSFRSLSLQESREKDGNPICCYNVPNICSYLTSSLFHCTFCCSMWHLSMCFWSSIWILQRSQFRVWLYCLWKFSLIPLTHWTLMLNRRLTWLLFSFLVNKYGCGFFWCSLYNVPPFHVFKLFDWFFSILGFIQLFIIIFILRLNEVITDMHINFFKVFNK